MTAPWEQWASGKQPSFAEELLSERGLRAIVREESTGEIISTVRVRGPRYRPPVYEAGKYTVKIGQDKPDAATHIDLEPT